MQRYNGWQEGNNLMNLKAFCMHAKDNLTLEQRVSTNNS